KRMIRSRTGDDRILYTVSSDTICPERVVTIFMSNKPFTISCDAFRTGGEEQDVVLDEPTILTNFQVEKGVTQFIRSCAIYFLSREYVIKRLIAGYRHDEDRLCCSRVTPQSRRIWRWCDVVTLLIINVLTVRGENNLSVTIADGRGTFG